MLKATKGNKMLRIPDERLSHYKAMGYTITQMDGTRVYEPKNLSQELADAQAANADLEKQVKKLTAEIEKLKGSKSSKASTKKTAKADAEEEPAEDEQADDAEK